MRQAVDAYERGEISANKLSTVLRQTDSRVNSLNSRLKDTQARMNDAGRATGSFGSVFRQVFAANVFAGGIEGMTRAVVGFGQDSVKAFASLDKLVRFTATLDRNFQTPENLTKFREDIQKLSTEIPHSAESIARASFTLKSAFDEATPTELINMLREFGNAATASNTDIASHTQNLAALAKQYNITGDGLREFGALIASAYGAALASDEKVAQGFNRILSAAQSTGQPLRDVVAAMSALQSVSSDAEQNTTLLLNVFAKLTDPKYIEGIKGMGVAVFDTAGNFRPLNQLINEMAKELEGLNDQQVNDKLSFAKDLQAREGLKILIRQVQDYNKILADGADQDAFRRKNDLMLNSAEAKWERLVNRVNSAKIEIGAAMVDIVERGQQLKIDAPKLDVNAWQDIIAGGLRTAISGAGAANVPVALRTGNSVGDNFAKGVAGGIYGGQNIIVQAARSVINWAFGSAQKEQRSQSPSQRAAEELGLPFVQGMALGIADNTGLVVNAAAGMVDKAFGPAVKKALATQIKELKKELSELNADAGVLSGGGTTGLRNQIFAAEQVKDQLEDLLRLRQELSVNADKPLIAGPGAAREITILNDLRDGISDIVGNVKEFLQGEDELGDILRLFADPKAAAELKRQADALGLTVEHMKTLAKLRATAGLEGTAGLNAPIPELAGIGSTSDISTTIEDLGTTIENDLLPPPTLMPAWDDFWGTFRDRLRGAEQMLPSFKQAIGVNLIDSIYGIGDVFGAAIARSDGTLQGFFQSVAQGFRQMAQSILADLARLAVQKLLFAIVGSVAGGSISGGAGIGHGGSSGIGYATGGFTGMGGKFEPAGIVHRGEYVIPSGIVKKIGVGFFDALIGRGGANRMMPAFAMGGMASTPAFVPQFSSAAPSSSVTNTTNQPTVINFNFHANDRGQFARQSAEQAAKAAMMQMNRTSVRN